MGKQWKHWLTLFLGSKITVDGDCNHESKRLLLLGRKVMTNLDSILKGRDITLTTKVHLVKAMVFPVVMYECESWTVKKAKLQRIDAFELWCWRRLLRVPWTARRSNQSILKRSVLGVHWKDWCWSWTPSFGHLMRRADSLGKTLMLGNIDGWEEKVMMRMRWFDGIPDSMDMGFGGLWEVVMEREAWRAMVHWVTKSQTWLIDWTEWIIKLNWELLKRIL